jgi:hypothetical protein
VGEAPRVAPVSEGSTFRTIGELATRCGHYCWVESRLFALTGSRASDPEGDERAGMDPETRVLLREMSFRHGLLATQWRERLPVRSGVDADSLIVAPPGSAAAVLDLLAGEPALLLVLKGLTGQFLPGLLDAYEHDLAQASPVGEAPVRALLEAAVGAGRREIHDVGRALRRLSSTAGRRAEAGDLDDRFKQVLGDAAGVFPAAWAS